MDRPLEAHFICKDRNGVVQDQTVFVTGNWALPLNKARLVGRVCLHERKDSAAFLSGHVLQVWISPDDGRAVFKAAIDDHADPETVNNWGFMSAFRPIARAEMTVEREALVRAVVRMGFVVAGADGLDDAEAAEVEQYAIERSGLTPAVVAEERRRSEGGIESVTDEDFARILALDSVTRSSFIDEFRTMAGADGIVSEDELRVLEFFAAKIT